MSSQPVWNLETLKPEDLESTCFRANTYYAVISDKECPAPITIMPQRFLGCFPSTKKAMRKFLSVTK